LLVLFFKPCDFVSGYIFINIFTARRYILTLPYPTQHKYTMTSNTVAWISATKAHPFEIKPAPLGTPLENQILIKTHAIAINPIDGKIQYTGQFPLKYPTILGQDVAGEVVTVGPHVTRFKKGDRVIGTAAGFATGRDEEKAFQACRIVGTATGIVTLFGNKIIHGPKLDSRNREKATWLRYAPLPAVWVWGIRYRQLLHNHHQPSTIQSSPYRITYHADDHVRNQFKH
jgi:hypothetical protein